MECVAFKVAFDEGWSLEEIDDAEFYYRCFLQAHKEFPNKRIVPTRKIDIFWHHHILDTQKYHDDCQKIFGHYLHHFPYSGIRGENDSLEQQRRSELSKQIIERIAEAERNAN